MLRTVNFLAKGQWDFQHKEQCIAFVSGAGPDSEGHSTRGKAQPPMKVNQTETKQLENRSVTARKYYAEGMQTETNRNVVHIILGDMQPMPV